MPCKECENGKYKWGETGECTYETLEDCQKDNADYYLEETFKPETHEPHIDHAYNFTQEEMEELHTNGELMVEVEEGDKKMTILFTYTPEEVDAEELEREYENLTDSLLDDELDEYIDKLADSIKKL